MATCHTSLLNPNHILCLFPTLWDTNRVTAETLSYGSIGERTAAAAIGVSEHQKPHVSGHLPWSPDLQFYDRFTPLIHYGLRWGSQSPTSDRINPP